ncbi:unnamed protein product [Soboliphyme baturini]|uniref:Copper transport protein n=1 Tax=Soboliphyme baturini TaxID=241478 RepID=A0A183IQI2_9BILA|nr:unnamed protein product [Soboliphyme baturini]
MSGHSSNDSMHMDMAMYFHFGYTETILFKGWAINSVGGLIGSMVAVFIIAALYEELKAVREILMRKGREPTEPDSPTGATNSSQDLTAEISTWRASKKFSCGLCSWYHLLQTFLQMLHILVAYLLMLVFMTYNVWLCVAIVLGNGCGYFLFGKSRKSAVSLDDHCQ